MAAGAGALPTDPIGRLFDRDYFFDIPFPAAYTPRIPDSPPPGLVQGESDMRLVRPLCFVSILFALTTPAHAADGSWVGKKIMTKEGAIDLRIVDKNDQWQVVGKVKDAVVVVEKEDGHWIKVRSGGVSGWIDKNDAVLLENAVDFFTDYIERNPRDAFGYGMRGIAWCEKGEYDIAIKDYGEAIRLDPRDPANFNSQGLAWSAKKEYDKALRDFDEAIRLDPKNAFNFNNRGLAWSDKKDYDKALKDYNEAIRLDPKDTMTFTNRGLVWYYKKDYDKAIKDYDKAIRLDPKTGLAFIRRGDAWSQKKEYDKAIKDLDEAIRLDAKSGYAFYVKACCFALQSKSDVAIENLQRAIELDFRDFEQMKQDTDLDSIRNDPRYKKLIEKYDK
jgi:tetratricopeptide (TPR) repeat protein